MRRFAVGSFSAVGRVAVLLFIVVAATGIGGARSSTPEAAIAAYFAGRFAAMDGQSGEQPQVSPANPRLRAFLAADLDALHALITSFPNVTTTTHEYTILTQSGMALTVYEMTRVTWQDRAGVRTSSIGYRHSLILVPTPTGNYIVAKDAFRGVGWDSPDVVLSATVPIQGGRTPGLAAVGARPNMSVGYYNWDAATLYAAQWFNGRNPAYANYEPNDCTNFVSQAMYAGGEVKISGWDAGWNCCNGSGQALSLSWINVNAHRNWMLNNGRGYSASSASALVYGDLIYYKWSGDSIPNHATMVTGYDGSGNRLVSMHSPDLGWVRYDTWMASSLKPFTAYFTALSASYYY
jgi:Putative amidase domain